MKLQFSRTTLFIGSIILLSVASIIQVVLSLIPYNMSAVGEIVIVGTARSSNAGLATIRYKDTSGKVWEFREEASFGPRMRTRQPQVGERVEVRYKEATPNVARLKSGWTAEWLLTLVAVIFLPIATYSFYRLSPLRWSVGAARR